MEITEIQYVKAYEVARQVFDGEIVISKGVSVLHLEHGLNKASASDFINDYKYLRKGQIFYRTMSAAATRYFIQKIFAEHGLNGLKLALSSLRLHIQYYEGHTKTTKHLMRSVASEFELLVGDFDAMSKRISSGTATFSRDSEIARIAKNRANGICEYCKQQGFETAQGGFYLEAHHVIPLSCNGDDQEWNVVAICPEDHKKAHFGIDRKKMRDDLIEFLGKEYGSFYEVLKKKSHLMDSDLKTNGRLEFDVGV